eukprot:scaffold2830_cov123-Isochrysis_galbana.AAC.4
MCGYAYTPICGYMCVTHSKQRGCSMYPQHATLEPVCGYQPASRGCMLHLNARAAPASALHRHHVSGGATGAPAEQTLIYS